MSSIERPFPFEDGEGERWGLAMVQKADQARSWHLMVLPVQGMDVSFVMERLVLKED